LTSYSNDTAMMVFHLTVRVKFFDRVVGLNFNCFTAGAITSGHINTVSYDNGSRYHSCSTREIRFPQQSPIIRIQSEIRASRGKIWTHPVVVNGKLYLRDQDLIYCYNIK
ncbi:hypothetical protein OAM21_04155, partial [Verrucomicrobia bacterium]|nr:hypothetical protein [Verrucomicrobiota bacterium]